MVGFLRLLGDDAHSVGGIVAADVEEHVDRVRLEDLENLLAIFAVGLVAGRAERGRGRRGDRLQIGDRLLPEIDEIVVDDAAHALERAIDMPDFREAPRLQRHAGQRLVDDRRRSASLGDKDLVRHTLIPPLRIGTAPNARTCVSRLWPKVLRRKSNELFYRAEGSARLSTSLWRFRYDGWKQRGNHAVTDQIPNKCSFRSSPNRHAFHERMRGIGRKAPLRLERIMLERKENRGSSVVFRASLHGTDIQSRKLA